MTALPTRAQPIMDRLEAELNRRGADTYLVAVIREAVGQMAIACAAQGEGWRQRAELALARSHQAEAK